MCVLFFIFFHSQNLWTSKILLLILVQNHFGHLTKNVTAACCVVRCSRIAELTEQLNTSEDKGRVEKEALLDHLHGLTAESTAAKLENQSLKVKQPTDSCTSLYSQTQLLNVKPT